MKWIQRTPLYQKVVVPLRRKDIEAGTASPGPATARNVS